jgi:hypothetical protein
MTIKSKTFTVDYVECGTSGHFKPGPEVTRYLKQEKLVIALSAVHSDLNEYRITRPEAAAKLAAALVHIPAEYQHVPVPPSLDQRLGFSAYGVLQRIAQDVAGTGPIAQAISLLAGIASEFRYGLGMFLVGAERMPTIDNERANAIYAAAEEISRQHRAYKGVQA